jgi:voltage-gated potassium channel
MTAAEGSGAAGPGHPHGWRRRLYLELDPSARTRRGLSGTNRVLVFLIVLAVLLAVLETERTLAATFGRWFEGSEIVLGMVFLLEYGARLWTAPESERDHSAWRSRLRFATSPSGITDLIATASSFIPVVGSSALLLRTVRLLRIFRLAKLGRMSRAMRHITTAIVSRREELLLSAVAGLFLMLASASVLFLVEGPVQPEQFGSIPRALWWAVATLTTIGYGDVYPITVLGKLLAGLTAVFSIGLIAMPTGILAAAFSDAMQKHKVGSDEPTP